MVDPIEDTIDCLLYLYPEFDFELKFAHSSGYNKELLSGLSTSSEALNSEWVGPKRKMQSSVLGKS